MITFVHFYMGALNHVYLDGRMLNFTEHSMFKNLLNFLNFLLYCNTEHFSKLKRLN